MSSHADTIRDTEYVWSNAPTDLGGWANRASEMREVAKALLAENQQLREALRRIVEQRLDDPMGALEIAARVLAAVVEE